MHCVHVHVLYSVRERNPSSGIATCTERWQAWRESPKPHMLLLSDMIIGKTSRHIEKQVQPRLSLPRCDKLEVNLKGLVCYCHQKQLFDMTGLPNEKVITLSIPTTKM
jgi:hypothetical protein